MQNLSRGFTEISKLMKDNGIGVLYAPRGGVFGMIGLLESLLLPLVKTIPIS